MRLLHLCLTKAMRFISCYQKLYLIDACTHDMRIRNSSKRNCISITLFGNGMQNRSVMKFNAMTLDLLLFSTSPILNLHRMLIILVSVFGEYINYLTSLKQIM